jgi:predicted amidophosphoribosyltransferase
MKNTQSLKPHGTCRECGAPLTKEEAYYYESRCEDCEGAWSERLNAWRQGEPDEYFDKVFGLPEQTKH